MKQMITGILLIPTLHPHAKKDANDALNAIVHQLGALNCEEHNDHALIQHTGILSETVKTVLNDTANEYGHHLIYLEAEDETPFVNNDTFHIPTDDEMIVYLGKCGIHSYT